MKLQNGATVKAIHTFITTVVMWIWNDNVGDDDDDDDATAVAVDGEWW